MNEPPGRGYPLIDRASVNSLTSELALVLTKIPVSLMGAPWVMGESVIACEEKSRDTTQNLC